MVKESEGSGRTPSGLSGQKRTSPQRNAVNSSRPLVGRVESGLELAGLVAGKAAIGSYRVDGTRSLPDQRLQEAMSINGVCDKQPHEIVLHRRERTAAAHLVGQLAMREAPRGHELGNVAHHRGQVYRQDLRVNVLAYSEDGAPGEIFNLGPALLTFEAPSEGGSFTIQRWRAPKIRCETGLGRRRRGW